MTSECHRGLFSFLWETLVHVGHIQDTVPGWRPPSFELFHREGIDKVERVRQKIRVHIYIYFYTEVFREIKSRIWKQRLRDLGLFSHNQRCPRGISLLPSTIQWEGIENVESDFSWMFRAKGRETIDFNSKNRNPS